MKPVFRKNEPFARISRTNLSENLDFSRIFSRFELAPSINKRLYTSLHLTDYGKIIYQNDPRETGFLNMYNFSMKNFIRLNGWGLNMTQDFFPGDIFCHPQICVIFRGGVLFFWEAQICKEIYRCNPYDQGNFPMEAIFRNYQLWGKKWGKTQGSFYFEYTNSPQPRRTWPHITSTRVNWIL